MISNVMAAFYAGNPTMSFVATKNKVTDLGRADGVPSLYYKFFKHLQGRK